MPLPPPHPSTSSSTPLRPRADRMKDSILRESSAGWANAITPLRIAKRDQLSPSSSSSPNPGTQDPTRVVARRSSNSYKHMFNNNLVSRSPFKQQLGPRQQPSAPSSYTRPVVPVTRKVSGEKRPRPDSLIQQAENENAKRVTELGYRRRQSKGFQGLVEKNPVSKSPFRQFLSPGREAKESKEINELKNFQEDVDMGAPIAIEFPTKGDDSTSPETTETDSSLNSRGSEQRPRTPPMHPTPPRIAPSPGFERRSPVPSALQGSPARSSLVQKSRLLGPRSRSLSAGASGTPIAELPPRRERRKTVTFDERCDVVEFDRDSCEDAVFDTDDEDVYGGPEPQQTSSQEVSLETSEYFDASELNDSINGLVESMLKEANNLGEPSTPELHTASLSSIVSDVDMMTGGAEDGIPLGRTHHAERARAYRQDEHLELPPPNFSGVEDDFFSTPQRQEPENIDSHTPRPFETPRSNSHGKMAIPPDRELDEEGIPLGRSHHAERARAVHQSGEDLYTKMMPPSPLEDVVPIVKHDTQNPLVPRFDLHMDDVRTSSPRGPTKEEKLSNDDVFGPISEASGLLAEFDFEQGKADPDLSLNTSVASFHEFPPRDESDYSDQNHTMEPDRDHKRHAQDFSFDERSDNSLDDIVSGLRLREDHEDLHDRGIPHYEHEKERTESSRSEGTVTESTRVESQQYREMDQYQEPMRILSSVADRNQNPDVAAPSPSYGLYAQREIGSASSLVGSDGRRSMSPRISREDVLRKLSRQRSTENYSPLGTPALASSASSMPKVEESEREDVKMEVEEQIRLPPTPSEIDHPQSRPPLEERLKRALSPSLPAPAPIRPAVIPSTSPAPPSPAGPSYGPVSASQPPVEDLSITRDGPVSSPPRIGQHGRAHTYDFDERPPPAPAKIVSGRSALSSSFDFSRPGVDIGDMDMRSALERLVDDVSIASGVEPSSVGNNSRVRVEAAAQDGDVSMTDTEVITEESTELLANLHESVRGKPPLERSGTAPTPAVPTTSTPERPPISRSVSEVSMMGGTSAAGLFRQSAFAPSELLAESDSGMETEVPPPPPPKTPERSARQAREEMIREKRKEARMRESGEYFVPPRRDASGKLMDESPASRRKSGPRPSAGRSMSTGDAEDLMSESASAQRRVSVLRHQPGGVLGVDLENDDGMLSASIQRELRKRDDPKKTYELRQHGAVVYASSSEEVSMAQIDQSLDVEDKAWRTLRRPSDINEHNQEIKAIRAQEKPGKAHGKLFVKVLMLRGLTVPIPPQLTMFTVTLNNGIHYVTTPECRLGREAMIEQEFELIEHSKLEFTLTVNIRRDPHILQQFKAITPPVVPPAAPSPTQHRGVRSFFGGTPKKPKAIKHGRSQTEPLVRFEMQENLARYMKQDGTLARAFIAFKDVANHCDSRLFESPFPLIGQRLEAPGEGGGAGGTMKPQPIGQILLQIFRLPPIPGLPPNQLPQSLDDCYRGLRTVEWHKRTYYEGVLTQLGGDCSTWRRRQLRVIGGSLVAFNDITKRAMATIDLKKVIAVEDDQDPKIASKRRDVDDYDTTYGVERSFRLVFPKNQEITFFADTDEEKANWLEVLRCMIGHVPPHALWAELLWQRKKDSHLAHQAQSSSDAPSS